MTNHIISGNIRIEIEIPADKITVNIRNLKILWYYYHVANLRKGYG